jgi:hypothetical protein
VTEPMRMRFRKRAESLQRCNLTPDVGTPIPHLTREELLRRKKFVGERMIPYACHHSKPLDYTPPEVS